MLSTTPAPSPRSTASRPSAPGVGAPKRLLVVDDEEAIRAAVSRYLQRLGYEVHTASGVPEALDQLGRMKFVCMLCDVRMPGVSGVEGLPSAFAADPDLAVLMLSGVNDAPTATEALSLGAMDYLLKPVPLPELQRAIERALHRRELSIERRRVEALIREEVDLRTSELQREKRALSRLTVGVAETLINAMEAKDVYLRGHSQRVGEIGASIAEHLGLDADAVEHVRLAGRLHDVGKIGIRESVMNKPGKLTPEEFEHVKDHVRIGMEILAPLTHIGVVLEYVRDHHEHWDGGGYPRGLAGERISIGGRILKAADAFDALSSRRAYRDPMPPAEVVAYLGRHEVGRLLDPAVFAVLERLVAGERCHVLTFIDDLYA